VLVNFTLPQHLTAALLLMRGLSSLRRFDVFILVPCYKESWATIKRTLMCAMFARVPPGCRKHIILSNDGHDVVRGLVLHAPV
jgi:hypothetical protein